MTLSGNLLIAALGNTLDCYGDALSSRRVASDLYTLRSELRNFAEERDWVQFHSPKNLALALAGEVGELCAVLQWLNDQQIDILLEDPVRNKSLTDEIADVLIYLVRLADVCGVDLIKAAEDKIRDNERRYPVELARGNAVKYSERPAVDMANVDQGEV